MKITIKGYKSISSPISIDINGLTILAGANSSGKSSFMQPLLLIKQTIESNFDTGALVLDGANARLSDSSDALSRNGLRRSRTFSISLENKGSSSSATFKRSPTVGLVVDTVSIKDKDIPGGLTITEKTSHDEIAAQIPNDGNPIAKLFQDKKLNAQWKIIRKKCFLNVEYGTRDGVLSSIKIGIAPSAMIEGLVKNIIHVPGLRGNPERSYRLAAASGIYPGSFESYVASIISNWREGSKISKSFEQLVADLNALGLASNIETTRINDTRVEVRVSRHKGAVNNDCVNIADVGFGVSQTLPVLVALITASGKQVVYIEQPELHLHPRAQLKLAEIINRAVQRGVRVVIETHSSILIRGIQTLVAKGLLDKKLLSFNWFTQDSRSGKSKVDQAVIDDNGAFGPWPADFDEVSMLADGEYLNAVEENLFGNPA